MLETQFIRFMQGNGEDAELENLETNPSKRDLVFITCARFGRLRLRIASIWIRSFITDAVTLPGVSLPRAKLLYAL